MDKMIIDIWSDIACPYCYIGKHKLEMALAQFPNREEIRLEWHSYELHPELPKKSNGERYFDFLERILGSSKDENKSKVENIIKLGAETGIKFNYDTIISANTSDALRLVKLAALKDLASPMEEALFEAYFVKGKDVSDKSTLIQIGSAIGLDKEEINLLLEGDRFIDSIKEDMRKAEQHYKLEYIPFYVLNGHSIIQGSISVDEYLESIEKAFKNWKDGKSDNQEMKTGKFCTLDGKCS